MGCCCTSEHEKLFKDLKIIMDEGEKCKTKDVAKLLQDAEDAKKQPHRFVQEQLQLKPSAQLAANTCATNYETTKKSVFARLDEEIEFFGGKNAKSQLGMLEKATQDTDKFTKQIYDILKKLTDGSNTLNELRISMQKIATENADSLSNESVNFKNTLEKREKKLFRYFKVLTVKVFKYTMELTNETRTNNMEMQRQINELNTAIKRMEEERKEYEKFKKDVMRQNELLKEDISRYEVVLKRKSMVEDVLTGSRKSPKKQN